MKNFLIITCLLISLPAFSACPLDGETTSCSIAEFHQDEMNPTYSPESLIKEFSGSPEARLKPKENKVEKELRNFGPQSTDYSYNTSCQFGVCNQSGTPQLFEKRGATENTGRNF